MITKNIAYIATDRFPVIVIKSTSVLLFIAMNHSG